MDSFTIYDGNWPSNVNRDAKYSVRKEAGEYVVGIEYRTDTGEKWYPTSDEHSGLVEMVNRIKIEKNSALGGQFYINEFRQVLVPAGRPVLYYYAGEYAHDLIFDFEGYRLSGQPVTLSGDPLKPGERWEGPHAGIPYKLKAGAKDISYDKELRPKVKQEICLSEIVGVERANTLAAKIGSIIGFDGGRFYINEFNQFFTGFPYTYIGKLERDEPWFLKPHS